MTVKSKILELTSKVDKAQTLISAYETLRSEPITTPNISVDENIREFHLSKNERKGYVLIPVIPGNAGLTQFVIILETVISVGFRPHINISIIPVGVFGPILFTPKDFTSKRLKIPIDENPLQLSTPV